MGASLHPGELGPPEAVGRRGGGWTPPAWDCSPSQAQGAAEMHHVPIALLPPWGPLQVQVTYPTPVPTHAGTYPTREAAKCWPNRKLSPANDAQFSPGSAGLQKSSPSSPNLCRAETHESSPCSPQHPRRSPQNPTPAFPTPEGKQNHPCDDLPWESLAHTTKMLREPCARLR